MNSIKMLLILGVVISSASVSFASDDLTVDTAVEFQVKDKSAFSRFVDQAAKENIQKVYLPAASDAYKISMSKTLNHQEKQDRLYSILKLAQESLAAQKNEMGFIFISPLVRYKLDQFNEAITVGDFNRTSELAQSAYVFVKSLTE